MACLEHDLDECLSALRLPFVHRRQIRTTNLLERLFGEGKRRSKVIPRFPSEASGMALLFAVLIDASEGWRGVRMRADLVAPLKQLAADPDSTWREPDLAKMAA
jgi:transposase-like protein